MFGINVVSHCFLIVIIRCCITLRYACSTPGRAFIHKINTSVYIKLNFFEIKPLLFSFS